jgi:hypothetical protein
MLKFPPAGGGAQIKMQPHTAGDIATKKSLATHGQTIHSESQKTRGEPHMK